MTESPSGGRRRWRPIFFCLDKRKSPRPVKRKPLRRKTGAGLCPAPVCLKRGLPTRDCAEDFQSKLWARSSSSQSPYPSLPAYTESSLIPMLVLSPQKPLRWVFAGAPILLKLAGKQPAAHRFRMSGRKTDLTYFSFRCRSCYLPASAKRIGERGNSSWSNPTTTPKAAPTPPNAEKHHLCSQRLKRTRQETFSLRRHHLARPRPCPNLPEWAGF